MTSGEIVARFYANENLAALFSTTPHLLSSELEGCDSVLDLGCGPNSPLRSVPVSYSVGVEIFKPYILSSQRRGVHDDYLLADLTRLAIRSNSVDAIVMIGVLEHLRKQEGYHLLKEAERIARKKIIVTCPNGFLPQEDHDRNPYQAHKSGWRPADLRNLGYRVHGLSGPRVFRKANERGTKLLDQRGSDPKANLLSTIGPRPKWFWLGVTAIFQIITYHLPAACFELLATMDIPIRNRSKHDPKDSC
jgi:hypothetical protein